jgi:hypothetical protein
MLPSTKAHKQMEWKYLLANWRYQEERMELNEIKKISITYGNRIFDFFEL